MSPITSQVNNDLHRIASSPRTGEIFAVERSQVGGEPTLWKEVVQIERGRFQSFTRIRNFVDGADIPIGTWTMPADEWRVKNLAAALSHSFSGKVTSDEQLSPGMDVVTWTCITTAGVFGVTAATASPVMNPFSEVDLEFKRLANDLEDSRHGASCRCKLDVIPGTNRFDAHLAFINDGDRACLLPNPLLNEFTDYDYVSIEVADVPREQPGVTGPEPEFKPVAMALKPDTLVPPWDDAFLLLTPGNPLVFPLPVTSELSEAGSYLVRGVYSHYGYLHEIAGVPVIRGAAFSNSVSLDV